ncbi:Osmoprotectant import ATP-binding protein OsmV [Austwickia sp. TVS 96-490-7B]|uniref:ABC transporter ATP-binding protein n=1 Tax=Austwickia sp. TVS 96-490-7B TaxID=2830843 RepID=UPI001C5A049E|nr:ATP-binding cassette domain-containing protein [Austwickia sp. TVS 96-490-7B]MBW3085140.1 Osmoprotectant import ATP-binding protein OsmV [Austwickia sp. TVS 96-490-7B]
MIRFEQVVKRYGEGSPVVDGLTLSAPEGTVTVLVGPSGCGKTTSLRMVNRMIAPTEGRILVGGEDVAAMDTAHLRRGIGYVIQHGGLFPHLTVERNVMTVPLLLGTPKAQARVRAHELLERVGLEPALARRYPAQLSGGQQQRVGVARALAADPPVLLMDEPFSAVDPVVRDQLQADLSELQRELRKTILFVTHDIDEAIRLGDQIAVLKVGGRLAQVADPATLLAAPADDFVAEFVGRDRGYRALGFVPAPTVITPVPERTVHLGELLTDAGRDGWVLVVDDHNRPLGWAEDDGTPGRRAADLHDDLDLGGTVATRNGPLRTYLDAALSSPSRRGVVVDDDGAVVGTVRVAELVTAMDSPRAALPVTGVPTSGVATLEDPA